MWRTKIAAAQDVLPFCFFCGLIAFFFPFLLLFGLSAFTRPVEKKRLDRFFGKLHTSVQPTPEEDEAAVERAAVHPEEFEAKKIWPGSDWEILKPGIIDIIGFGGSCLLVVFILFLLWGMAGLGT